MKIGFVLDDKLDVADGVQQYIKTLGTWLKLQGHEVHYLVASPDQTDSTIHGLSRTLGLKFNKNRVRIPLPVGKAKLKQLLAREQFDILHVQMPYAPWFSGQIIAAAPANTAIVGTFHVVVDSPLVATISPALRLVYRRTKKRFRQVCAVSPAALDYLRASMDLTGSVIPNAVDVSRFTAGQRLRRFDDKKRNIVFLGRLVERKGAEYLLRAYADLQFPSDSRLILIGDGPLRSSLELLAKQLGIAEHVLFEGFIDEADKPHYLASADIAVFPATGGESFGIVLLEAMAANAGVVLGGDNPGYSSVLGELPETLFSPMDTAKLTKLLEQLQANKTASKRIHAAQAKLLKRYDINTVGKQILAMYTQAIQQ